MNKLIISSLFLLMSVVLFVASQSSRVSIKSVANGKKIWCNQYGSILLSNTISDSTTLWDMKSVNEAKYPDTFYIINASTGLYLTSIFNGAVRGQAFINNDNRFWQYWQKSGKKLKNIATGKYLVSSSNALVVKSDETGEDWLIQ